MKDGALAISTQDVALHLTGVKNSTTYKVVSNASVGYWMMKNCPEQFFHSGKVAVSEDKTSESDEKKKRIRGRSGVRGCGRGDRDVLGELEPIHGFQ